MAIRQKRQSFGRLRQRDSGRWQASFMHEGQLHRAPDTFDTKIDAQGWLNAQDKAIKNQTWQPFNDGQSASRRKARTKTFGEYATEWVASRVNSRGESLRPRTLVEYQRLIAGPLAPFTNTVLSTFTPPAVRSWRAREVATGKATQTARAYSLLKSILSSAISDGVWGLTTNPCNERGAANATTGRVVTPPTDAQLAKILETITPKYRAAVLIAAWAGCRYGELTELRRKDVTVVKDGKTVEAIIVNVTRAVTHTTGHGFIVGKTKSAAGVRSIALPPHIHADILTHLSRYTGDFPNAFLFPAADGVTHLGESTFVKHWYPARHAAKRDDLAFHGLRHYGATKFAQTGATLREIQERIGHSTVSAAMRYQHTAGRDLELAKRMSDLA